MKNEAKNTRNLISKESLGQLHVNGFDEEQIWQQIELENSDSIKKIIQQTAKLCALKDRIKLNLNPQDDKDDKDEDEEKSLSDDSSEEEEVELEKKQQEKKKKVTYSDAKKKENKIWGSAVDDKFFKLSELEKFLKNEDMREEKQLSGEKNDDDDDFDYYGAVPSDEEGYASDEKTDSRGETFNARKITYKGFFDPPEDENDKDEIDEDDSDISTIDINEKNLDTRDADFQDVNEDQDESEREMELVSSDDESEEDNFKQRVEKKSSDSKNETISKFQLDQEKLAKKISNLEQQNISEKPWQLKGEVSSERRPENSLLAEHVQFDHNTMPAPLITEETTKKLEDLILQRIKDSVWDDVVRKVKIIEQPFEYKRRITLDQEKSKASLAQVYEQEFLKKQMDDKTEEENPEHKEVKNMMRKLFAQLDALSNFHYTPKPPEPEVKIINNLPAIAAEEPTPSAVADSSLMAPQEIMDKAKFDIKSSTERTETDKKHERRLKKKNQSRKRKFEEMKEKTNNKVTSKNKYNKIEILKKLKETKNVTLADDLLNNDVISKKRTDLTSSKAFFNKLQDKMDAANSSNPTKKKSVNWSSKNLKL